MNGSNLILKSRMTALRMRLPTGNDDLPILLLFLLGVLASRSYCLEVIYAINAGGEAHTDSYGIHFARDPLMGKVGTASDYGKQLIIGRIGNMDQILYQTERYHHNTFGYDIPISQDGNYVMILKFCEVYFNSPNMKVTLFVKQIYPVKNLSQVKYVIYFILGL